MTRLRAALDELTTGAEPNESVLTPVADRQPRRWMLPAVAAAAVALVVTVAVVGRGDRGTPAAPTPTGPPVTATIPWYELRMDDATVGSAPVSVGSGVQGWQAWATADYARVLVAQTVAVPNASAPDWGPLEPVPDPPVGLAWRFAADASASTRSIYWAPDDDTSVVITGVGFDEAEFAAVLPALSVQTGATGPTLVSTLSGLAPIPFGAADHYAGMYELESREIDPSTATVHVSDGAGVALTMLAVGATSIAPATTPFGDGFRVDIARAAGDPVAVTMLWWQVDGGPFWAGLSAPPDRIDELLTHLARVADIPAPGPTAPPAPAPAQPEVADAPPASVLPCTAPPPSALATQPPARDGQASTPASTTTVACGPAPAALPPTTLTATPGPPVTTTTSMPSWEVNEPAMTALMPSSPGGDGRPPVAVGESVMLSAAQDLGDQGITVYAEEASQAADIAEELERLRSIDSFGSVVIVQAGTNGSVTQADLDRIIAAVADVERVVLLTAHADRSWIAPNNELIRALPARYSNVVVLDWDAIATTCDCLVSDGVHVADGDVYADAVVAAAGLG